MKRSFFVLLAAATCMAQQTTDRAAWMKDARWGVMTHYLADWKARDFHLTMSVDQWNQLVGGFDVETLAKQLESVGAKYYIITLGQNSGYYLSPNFMYDHYVGIQPSKCSRRDLVAELSDALGRRNIKLVLYLPSGAPGGDRVARKGLAYDTEDPRKAEFQLRWENVIREWSKRYGKKIAGWWFDGCYTPNAMYRYPDPPNFESFAAAARYGNPDAAVAFNPGVFPRITPMSPYQDYTAGEINDPAGVDPHYLADGKVDGAQIHVLSYLGRTWGTGDPRFTTEQVTEWSRKVNGFGGAITWDTPVQLNGTIAQPFVEQLAAVGRVLGTR